MYMRESKHCAVARRPAITRVCLCEQDESAQYSLVVLTKAESESTSSVHQIYVTIQVVSRTIKHVNFGTPQLHSLGLDQPAAVSLLLLSSWPYPFPIIN
jgi:hypothetical protein